MNKDFFYIYNFKQAKFFIDNGLSPIEIKKSNQGKVYQKFIRNIESEFIFNKWCKRSKF